MNKVQEFRVKWKIPLIVVLADGDNELLINLSSSQMVSVLIDTVKKRSSFTLKEFLFDKDASCVKNADGTPQANQFVAFLLKEQASYPPSKTVSAGTDGKPSGDFSIGSEWIYFKIYCGPRSADLILKAAIKPFSKKLLENKMIDRFFFIRYTDPDFHLRVRFHAAAGTAPGKIIEEFHKIINPFEKQHYIWRLQMDTYRRELDRYGCAGIEHAEQIFFRDSEAVLRMLDSIHEDDGENVRWSYAIKAIDQLFTDFGLTLTEKHELSEQLRLSFHQEFKVDKALKEQLNDKYRLWRKVMEKLLDSTHADQGQICDILKERSMAFQRVIPQIKDLCSAGMIPSLQSLLTSYIHMMVNRIVTDKARFQELFLYDMLYNYYNSMIRRSASSLRATHTTTELPVSSKNQLVTS